MQEKDLRHNVNKYEELKQAEVVEADSGRRFRVGRCFIL